MLKKRFLINKAYKLGVQNGANNFLTKHVNETENIK